MHEHRTANVSPRQRRVDELAGIISRSDVIAMTPYECRELAREIIAAYYQKQVTK